LKEIRCLFGLTFLDGNEGAADDLQRLLLNILVQSIGKKRRSIVCVAIPEAGQNGL